MKPMSFMQFLLREAKQAASKQKANTRLLPSFACFKEWLSEWPDALDNTGIELADIEKLYSAAKKSGGSMPEPVVADYNQPKAPAHGPGVFALRKWTRSFFPSDFPDGIRGTGFAGFHNTRLKSASAAKPG